MPRWWKECEGLCRKMQHDSVLSLRDAKDMRGDMEYFKHWCAHGISFTYNFSCVEDKSSAFLVCLMLTHWLDSFLGTNPMMFCKLVLTGWRPCWGTPSGKKAHVSVWIISLPSMSERFSRYTWSVVFLWTACLTTPQLGKRFNRRPAHGGPGGWVIKVSDSKSKKWSKVTSWSFTSTASVLEHMKPVFRKEEEKKKKTPQSNS